jgi:hypothetical protein
MGNAAVMFVLVSYVKKHHSLLELALEGSGKGPSRSLWDDTVYDNTPQNKNRPARKFSQGGEWLPMHGAGKNPEPQKVNRPLFYR